MKRFYPYRQNRKMYALFAVLMIILPVTLVVNVLRLTGSAGLSSSNPALDVAAIVIVAIAAAMIGAAAFASGYYLRRDRLICFIGLGVWRIDYRDILVIRVSSDKRYFLLYVAVENGGNVVDPSDGRQAAIYQIQIAPKHYDAFVAHIQQANPKTLYEQLDAPASKEKKPL